MIDLTDTLEDQLTSGMHTAAGEKRDVEVPFAHYSHNTVKAYAYRIRRELGYNHVIQFKALADRLVLSAYKIPEQVVTKPPASKASMPAATVNQVITRKVPTGEHLAAYRILINAGVLDCVEILDYNKERFERDFPGVKAFMLEDTKKGVLLL